MKIYNLLISICFILLLATCANESSDQNNSQSSVSVSLKGDQFGDYWYQGKAEISSYALQQVRYGEIHEGKATLIFVTEDFSKSKQVKLDNPGAAGKDAVKVMKLNKVKKFNTGVYPYSMMTSVFSPVAYKEMDHALKITTSVQEWCGQVFMQLNNRKSDYTVRQYSYFESEGDQEKESEKGWLEDELWNLIRLDPQVLPTGEFEMYPSQFYARLKHRPYRPMKVTATKKEYKEGQQVYELNYPQARRTLKIFFDKKFPHKIQAWEETVPAGWGGSGNLLTTKAKRLETKLLDYWNKNSTADTYLRKELLLE